MLREPQRDVAPRTARRRRRRLRHVSEAHTIDLADLRRRGLFDLKPWEFLFSRKIVPGPQTSEVGCTLWRFPKLSVVLIIDWPPTHLRQIIHGALLENGPRPRFRCLHPTSGGVCLRTCRILYRGPESAFFGCRVCSGLTYYRRADHRPVADLVETWRVIQDRNFAIYVWENLPVCEKVGTLIFGIKSFDRFLQRQFEILKSNEEGVRHNASQAVSGSSPITHRTQKRRPGTTN